MSSRNRPGNGRRKAVLQAHNNRCYYCGKKATTIDHIMPVSRGGNSEIDNLVASCLACNQRAGDRPFQDRDQKRSYLLGMLALKP